MAGNIFINNFHNSLSLRQKTSDGISGSKDLPLVVYTTRTLHKEHAFIYDYFWQFSQEQLPFSTYKLYKDKFIQYINKDAQQ